MAKRPRDPNQLAKLMLDIVTGEVQDDISPKKRAPIRGQKGGLKGGNARAEKLDSEERRRIAKKAAETRWHK